MQNGLTANGFPLPVSFYDNPVYGNYFMGVPCIGELPIPHKWLFIKQLKSVIQMVLTHLCSDLALNGHELQPQQGQ